MNPSILTSVQDGVATLQLNRPDAMNALDSDTARAIRDSVEAFGADDGVRVLVVGGEGPAFSAGTRPASTFVVSVSISMVVGSLSPCRASRAS